MKSHRRKLEFAEFIKLFRDRYFYEAPDGLMLIAMTSDEALLLSKYLFRGVVDWAAEAGAAGTGELEDLGESLQRYAGRNLGKTDSGTNLELMVAEEDLRSLGAFLAQGLAAVFLTLESGHGKAYCC
jgi:hypothetical protein